MFPDSGIADKFSMGSMKVGYMATFGLGPYFSDMLKAKARDTDGFDGFFYNCFLSFLLFSNIFLLIYTYTRVVN